MNKDIKGVTEIVKKAFSDIDGIISIYLYGSFLREDFNKNSDIDLLVIVDDKTDINTIEKEIGKRIYQMEQPFEVTLITHSEVKDKLHAGWSKYFYFNVKKMGLLFFGKDILNEIGDYEISFDEIYKKIVWLSQRIRCVVINKSKEVEIKFWERKLKKWIKTIMSELLYLNGIYEPEPRKSFDKFFEIYPNLTKVNTDEADLKQMLELLEGIRVLCLNLKQNMKVREGIAVVIFKQIGNDISFLLLSRAQTEKGWEIIKGGIEEGENIEVASLRETKEEAGLSNTKFIGKLPYSFEFKMIKDGVLQKRRYQSVLVEHISGEPIIIEKDFKEAHYFNFEEAKKKIIWPKYRKAINVAFEEIRKIKAN